MSVEQIRKGSSDVLVFYPPEDAAPSQASLTITDANGSELSGFVWPQTVSRDSASATVSVAASQGARAVSVNSNANFVIGETYVLTEATTGQKYRVRIAGVPSGKVVLDEPLQFALTTAATITGIAYRFATNSTMTGEVRRRCRAKWSYTAVVAQYHQQRVDIVREPWRLALTVTNIEAYDHTFGETVGVSGRWQTLVQGVSDTLMLWIEKRKLYADLLKDRDFLTRAGALLLLSRFYGARPGADNQALSNKWNKAYEAALVDLADADLWYDEDDDDSLDGDSDGVSVGEDDEDELGEDSELGLPGYYAQVG
jgi:hypothetical protein